MNPTPSAPLPVLKIIGTSIKTLIRWLGSGLSWLLVIAAIVMVLFQVGVKYLLGPVIEEFLDDASTNLTEVLGTPVKFGFADFKLSFSVSGAHIVAASPFMRIGGDLVTAKEAQVALYRDDLPALHLDQLEIFLVLNDEGQLALGQLIMPEFNPRTPATTTLADVLPFDVITTNTQINLTLPDASTIRLTDIDLGIHPDVTTNEINVSFTTNYAAYLPLRGRLNIAPFTEQAQAYLQIFGAERYLAEVFATEELITATGSSVEIWAEYVNDKFTATLIANANDVAADLSQVFPAPATELTETVISAAPTVASAEQIASIGELLLRADLVEPQTLTQLLPLELELQLAASEVTFNPGEPALGRPLLLDEVTLAGNLNLTADAWDFAAEDIRFTGEIGTGSLVLDLHQTPDTDLHVDLRGGLPVLDTQVLTGLLPLALSERGVPFLRNDLFVAKAQVPELIVRGSDFANFPWQNRRDGEFRLGIDFYDATLDYATGYPLLEDGLGSILIDAGSLAVTVSQATVASSTIDIARAGVDDLTAVASTLFVAANASIPPDGLRELLYELPATKAQANANLPELHIRGGQQLNLALVIPLDTDDPVDVNGSLATGTDNAITYTPLDLTLTELDASFDFDDTGVKGIGYGQLFDAGVRVSLAVTETTPHIEIDGSFDIAAALAELDLASAVPLSGRSEIKAVIKGKDMQLSSNLIGTHIDLPPPLGKGANEQRNIRVALANTQTTFDYGDGFLKAAVNVHGEQVLAFNQREFPTLQGQPGAKVYGELAQIDLDNLAGNFAGEGTFPLNLPTAIELELPNAKLLGLEHPTLQLAATIAATTTVALIDAAAVGGQINLSAAEAIAVSISHLYYPEEEAEDLSTVQTIYVEDGQLTPVLPALDVVVDELRLGDITYLDLTATGAPVEDTWVLTSLAAATPGANAINVSGYTHTAGEPYSQINLDISIGELEKFINNYTESESIKGGSGKLSGTLSWQGALNEPHYLSLAGELNVGAQEFILNRDSGGTRLLNLLSPFTLLQELTELPADGFLFDNAQGTMRFAQGELILDPLHMHGTEIDIVMTGNTNLISRRNNLISKVELNKSGNVTTAAAATVNPLAGAFFLFFDKVLDQPLLGNFRIDYSITGTWDEPIVGYDQPTTATE